MSWCVYSLGCFGPPYAMAHGSVDIVELAEERAFFDDAFCGIVFETLICWTSICTSLLFWVIVEGGLDLWALGYLERCWQSAMSWDIVGFVAVVELGLFLVGGWAFDIVEWGVWWEFIFVALCVYFFTPHRQGFLLLMRLFICVAGLKVFVSFGSMVEVRELFMMSLVSRCCHGLVFGVFCSNGVEEWRICYMMVVLFSIISCFWYVYYFDFFSLGLCSSFSLFIRVSARFWSLSDIAFPFFRVFWEVR